MEILLWLVPPVLATAVTMAWVAWWGREGRGAVDRDVALRRLGSVLEAQPGRRSVLGVRRRRRPGYAVPPRPADRSSGVALRAPSEPASPPEVDLESPESPRQPRLDPAGPEATAVATGRPGELDGSTERFAS